MRAASSKSFLSQALSVVVICLSTAPCSFGQTRDRRPADAQLDITLLKRLVAEQGRRIASLEKTVEALKATTIATTLAANPQRPAVEEHVKITKPAPSAPWQIPFAWTRVKEGMSRAHVIEILGQPTSADSVMDYQTLTYKSDVVGSAPLIGTVKLTDDRVSQLNPPEF